MRALHHGLTLSLLLALAPGAARAIPAPMTEDRLQQLASFVVEGRLISAIYLATRRSGQYTQTSYRGELQLSKVLKGALRPGQVITLLWESESVAPARPGGPQPVGRSPQPAYYPCERVRVYLNQSNQPGQPPVYVTAYWNGRRQLAPGSYTSPTEKRRTLRCVGGKAR